MTKRIMAVWIAIMMTWMSPVAMAQPIPATPLIAPSSVFVGVIAAVTGDVHLETPGQVGRLVQSGERVYKGDIVKTDSKSTIQLMLVDETVFTIGPNSSMTIDEFTYDPSTDAGKISARVIEGAFRFITGRIPQKKPSNMEVKLPVGVMAVRGTIVYLNVKGQESTGVLAGPGERHNTHHRIGKFIMMNEVGRGDGTTQIEKTHVTQPGRASRIGGINMPPTRSFDFPKAEYNQLKSQFIQNFEVPKDKEGEGGSHGGLSDAPRPADEDGESGSAPGTGEDPESDRGPANQGPRNGKGKGGELRAGGPAGNAGPAYGPGPESASAFSGQDAFMAFEGLDDTFYFDDINDFIDDILEEETNYDGDGNDDIYDGPSIFRDLRLETGQYHYETNGVLDGGGSYTFKFNIDFGAETVGGGGSTFSGTADTFVGTKSFALPLGIKGFGNDGEFAMFDYQGQIASCGQTGGCSADVFVDFNNENGVAGASAFHSVTITENDTQISEYAADVASRESGSI